jgi:D-glycero-beta-D-manno-heptose 1-phosphate adenylyltransferase
MAATARAVFRDFIGRRRPAGAVPAARDKLVFRAVSLWFFSGPWGDSLNPAVLTLEQAILRFGRDKRNGRRIVFTNGCFDLLHPGHMRALELARALGDTLIVGLNSDASVRQLKGEGRPIIPEGERAEILAALESVDAVVIFDELTPREVISRLLPDVLVKGGDWPGDQIVGREEVEAAGGRVVSVPVVPGYSTSAILRKIREGFGPSRVNKKPQPKGARSSRAES